MSFQNKAILIGLIALAIPILIHLLNRRRYDVIDWAAMQFLQISRRTRRKVAFEQWLLLLTRLGLVALLVFALADPVLKLDKIANLPGGERLARWAGQTNRDIVLVIDGSYSMDYRENNTTAHDAAIAWAKKFVNDLSPGDRVAIVQAKQQPIVIQGILTRDRHEITSKLEAIPRPRGGIDWPRAITEARNLLQPSPNAQREIIILTDGQRQGWADPRSIEGWQLLALNADPDTPLPRTWVVNVAPDRPDSPVNWQISPIRANRSLATVDREVKFKFELLSSQTPTNEAEKQNIPEAPEPPEKVMFEIDGSKAGERVPPRVREPQVGMEFATRFPTTGSHLFSVMIGGDALPGDNRRDYAIDVLPVIPVLIVDGDRPGQIKRSSDFVRFAIAPSGLTSPSFLVRTISIREFGSRTLFDPIGKETWSVPRVLILQDVPALKPEHLQAIEEFFGNGGGIFILPGGRVDAESYNQARWLPARFLKINGDDKDLTKAAFPIPASVEKTFLDLFKESEPESFAKSSFSRWWKLDPAAADGGSIVAELTTRDPLFVEKSVGKGRVLLAAVPLDDSWRSSFLQSHDFVRLCHECLFYLTASRSGDVNLEPRQPIIFRPANGEPPGGLTVEPPEGPARRVDVAAWPFVYEDTRETGIYKLRTDSGSVQYFVVQPEAAESQLTATSESDRQEVARSFPKSPLIYQNDRATIVRALRQGDHDPQLWWLFLILLIGLLFAELAFTRNLVKRNPPLLEID